MSIIVAELYDALRAAGVSDEKARAAASAVVGTDTQNGFATKADLASVRGEIAGVRGEIAELLAAVRGEIVELRATTRADLAELQSRLIQWNVGTIIAMTAVFAAIVKLL